MKDVVTSEDLEALADLIRTTGATHTLLLPSLYGLLLEHAPAEALGSLDVVIVAGDHSTPAAMRSHSWHPVPVALAADTCRVDGATTFGETQCLGGGLGRFEAKHLMTLALAHAGRLAKFGA